ncbi:MAG: DUF58 domain-containing protein [Chloroflexota bacterium]
MTKLFEEGFLRRLEGLALVYRRLANSAMQGERRSARRGQSVEFADFRPYTSGDDFRRIDWNAFARLERLFIKLFVEEEDATLHLVIDASRSMDWGEPNKLQTAARLAGSLGYIALSGLDRVSIAVLDEGGVRRLPALRGKRAAVTMFDALAALRPTQAGQASGNGRGRGGAAGWSEFAGQAGSPGPLVLLSDLMDDGWQAGLNRLAGRGFEVSLLHVLAPDELQPELAGDFKLVDQENGAEVEISANYETLERYRRTLQSWQDGWRAFCAPRGLHYLPLNTAAPLEELLFAWLPQAGMLR